MNTTALWVKRYLMAVAIAFVLLMAAALLRGRTLDIALTDSAVWALISAAIYISIRIDRRRRGVACALCKGHAGQMTG